MSEAAATRCGSRSSRQATANARNAAVRTKESPRRRSSHAASIRANKKAVFAHENKGFNSAFALVIVNVKIGVIKEARQSKPMVESIVNGLHQGVGGIKSILKSQQFEVQGIY